MDIRDLRFWVKEAERKMLTRRAELNSAALLPHQKSETVRTEMEGLRWKVFEIDHDDEIDELDRKAQEKRERDKAARAERRRERKKAVKNG